MSDRVRVQVGRVDLDARKIDFRLVRDTPVKPPAPRPPVVAGETANVGNGGAGPRIRPFGDDDLPGTRARGGTKKGAPISTNPRAGAAKKRGAASKSAPQGRPARKKR
jgi:ribonuclease R